MKYKLSPRKGLFQFSTVGSNGKGLFKNSGSGWIRELTSFSTPKFKSKSSFARWMRKNYKEE